MEKLLIVAATPFEIEPLRKVLQEETSTAWPFLKEYKTNKCLVDIAITGAGMTNTAFCLGQLVGTMYSKVINAGVCGSFKDEISIGEVVEVVDDCFSDLGAQDNDSFMSFSEIGLGTEKISNQFRIASGKINKLRSCSGITVNTVHGNESAIRKIVNRLNPDIESMEGAAFLSASNYFKWRSAQIRSVSNKVEKRNKANWNMPLAIKNLNDFIIEYINEI